MTTDIGISEACFAASLYWFSHDRPSIWMRLLDETPCDEGDIIAAMPTIVERAAALGVSQSGLVEYLKYMMRACFSLPEALDCVMDLDSAETLKYRLRDCDKSKVATPKDLGIAGWGGLELGL